MGRTGCLAVAVAVAVCAGGTTWADERMILPETWQIQPAADSQTPPAEKEWGTTVSARGTPWEKRNRREIDSWWYEQTVAVPAGWLGRRLFLDFRRVEGDAIVFVNGSRLGERLRPGGEIDINSAAKAGQDNTLRVFVTKAYTDISRKFEEDKLRYYPRTHEWGAIPKENWGVGITAPVTLIARPSPAGISDVFVRTSWRDKEIAFDVEVDSDSTVDGVSARVDITEADGRGVLSFAGDSCSITAGRSTLRIFRKWQDPVPWELDGGHLYTARVELLRDGVAVDAAQAITFGFREVWTEGRKLMLNGHATRLRLLGWFGNGNQHALSFFRLMGFNAAYIQANPSMWWRDWRETPVIDEDLLDAMDRSGFAVLLPSPGMGYLGEQLLKDDVLRRDFERETNLWIRRYRNHPSVMGWIVGMNTYNPRDAISPGGMGRRYTPAENAGKPNVILAACDVVHRLDPTRLAYSHADGNLGDIASANMYLNFVPLQEREEWPLRWAENGDMPYQMAEFGQPYTANFFKGKRFLPTEYFSIYFGDQAYADETDAGLQKLTEYGSLNKSGHGTMVDWDQYPVYWDFQRLFVRRTNRAFRTWGVNAGWAYWNLDTGFGDLPDTRKHGGGWIYNRYANLKEACTSKPDWANANFNIHSQANQPILAYLAGWPRHTDKTHLYFGAEPIEKAVAVVWDGPGAAALDMKWRLRAPDGTLAAEGALPLAVEPGDSRLIRIAFAAPAVRERTDYVLELQTKCNGNEDEGDSFSISVFPRPVEPLKLRSKIAVWDPVGQSSAWLTALGVAAAAWKPEDGTGDIGVLIIGREALKPGEAMPYSPDDVRNGLKVLVLEQLPAVWQGLGFRTTEAMPRRVFSADPSCPALAGLQPGDLFDWRGSPDLLPEGKNQPAQTRHAPKWLNTHALASSVPQIPRCVGFAPIVACEFDMDYAPLLEWRDGRGLVVFCAFDLTGRVGMDPAATLVARHMLEWVDAAAPAPTRRVIYRGGPDGLSLLRKLGADPDAQAGLERPEEALLVIGEADAAVPATELERFVESGGHVLVLPQTADRLAAMGLKTSRQSLQRAPRLPDAPVFRAIGPNLLRWREAVDVDVFDATAQPAGVQILAAGLVAHRVVGKGEMIFCQIAPSLLADRHADDEAGAQAVELSVFRLEQLVARLLTNLGASPAKPVAARLCWLDLGPQFEVLSHWNILGPYFVERDDGEAMLAETLPGEETAIVGDANPNPTFTRPDGVQLNWRPTIKADEKGFVNLASHYQRESLAVAYAATTVESDTDREAVLRLGCDWRMRVWVNGQEVFKTLAGMNKAAAYSVKVRLRRGVNTVSCKIGSGSKGFGFYADLSKAAPPGAAAMADELHGVSFYAGRKLSEEFDPYEYFYW